MTLPLLAPAACFDEDSEIGGRRRKGFSGLVQEYDHLDELRVFFNKPHNDDQAAIYIVAYID